MVKKKDTEKSAQNDDTNRSNNIENGENDESNFSDPEGFVDDITDEGIFYFFFKFLSPIFFLHMAASFLSILLKFFLFWCKSFTGLTFLLEIYLKIKVFLYSFTFSFRFQVNFYFKLIAFDLNIFVRAFIC